MRFTGAPGDHQVPKTSSSVQNLEGEHRALLQVPTLAKDANGESNRARLEEPVSHPGSIRRPSPGPISWPMAGYQHRNEDPYNESQTWGHGYPDRVNHTYPGSVYNDSRYGISRHRPVESGYAPPQVRSGRGAMRLSGASRSALPTVVVPSQPSRSSFPVSNRGKGRNRGATSVPVSSYEGGSMNGSSSSSCTSFTLEEAQRVGNSVKDMAAANSRKGKRKLPLARRSDQPLSEGVAVQET